MTDWTLIARGHGQYEVVAPATATAPVIILHVGPSINQTELLQIAQAIQFSYENRPNLRANMQLAAQRGLTIGMYVSEAPKSGTHTLFQSSILYERTKRVRCP